MKLNDLSINIEASFTVSAETAELALKIVETFANNNNLNVVAEKYTGIDGVSKTRLNFSADRSNEMNLTTPYKPELISEGDWNGEPVYDLWRCPRCNTGYETEYDRYKHCPECGQAIDWSEYDDLNG